MSNVKIIDNVLSKELLKSVFEYVRSNEIHHSYQLWQHDVIRDSNPVLIKHFKDEIKSKLLDEVKQHFPEYKNDIIGFSWYGWIRGSYIPWHSDGHCEFAATIYLNDHWDDDWGGYFAYEETNEIKCIKPEFNRMVIIKPPIRHTVFNISSVAPIRETIQIFAGTR